MHGARTTGLFLQEVMIVKHKVPETKCFRVCANPPIGRIRVKMAERKGLEPSASGRDRPTYHVLLTCE